MNRVHRPGRTLQLTGISLFLLGGALFVIIAVRGVAEHVSDWWVATTTRTPTPTLSIPDPPPSVPVVTLDVAKRTIPEILKQIYGALNDGRPRDAAPLLHPAFFNTVNGPDYLCQPFNYRAHYIVSIVERPNSVFLARVRTLFKAGGERSYLMYFTSPTGDHLWLNNAANDPFDNEKMIATNVARNFIFAARAGTSEIAQTIMQLRRPGDYLGVYHQTWQETFKAIKSVELQRGGVEISSEPFLSLKVPLVVDVVTQYEHVDVSVDPITDAIIEVDWGFANMKSPIIKSADFETLSLARFGLGAEQ
jgi:hypothetical protein